MQYSYRSVFVVQNIELQNVSGEQNETQCDDIVNISVTSADIVQCTSATKRKATSEPSIRISEKVAH